MGERSSSREIAGDASSHSARVSSGRHLGRARVDADRRVRVGVEGGGHCLHELADGGGGSLLLIGGAVAVYRNNISV